MRGDRLMGREKRRAEECLGRVGNAGRGVERGEAAAWSRRLVAVAAPLAVLAVVTASPASAAPCTGFFYSLTPADTSDCPSDSTMGNYQVHRMSCATGIEDRSRVGYECSATGFKKSDCSGDCRCSTEICDGADNDCDGQIDEDGVCGASPQPPKCLGKDCRSEPLMVGDSFHIASGGAYDRERDFSVATALGEFSIFRTYTSDVSLWTLGAVSPIAPPLADVPKPFGGSPVNAASLNWWYNLFSFVFEDPSGSSVTVHDTYGRLLAYVPCVGSACWLSNAPSQLDSKPANRDRLRSGALGGGLGYVLYDEDGTKYEYAAPRNGTQAGNKYFLSRIRNAQDEDLATIAYQTPTVSMADGGVVACPNLCGMADGTTADCPSGAPYVSTVTLPTGTMLRLSYQGLNGPNGLECVVSELLLSGPGGELPVVHYDYLANQPGVLSKVKSIGLETSSTSTPIAAPSSTATSATSYEYPDGGLTVLGAGGEVKAAYGFDSYYRVLSQTDPSEDLSVAPWRPDTHQAVVVDRGPQERTGGTGVTRQYFTQEASGYMSARVASISETCVVPWACAQGTEEYLWGVTAGGLPYERGVHDKRNYYEVFDRTDNTSEFPQLTEVTSIAKGATSADGANALEVETRTYTYGPVSRRQLIASRTTRRDSSVPPTTVSYTYAQDASDHLLAEVRTGMTRIVGSTGYGFDLVTKSIGTLYTYHPAASGNCLGDTANEWVLSVDGPCEVGNGQCVGNHPITQYVYATATQTDGTRGQLRKVLRFPAGCGSEPLITQYTHYDAFGNILRTIEENGSFTLATWDGPSHRQLTRTVAAGTPVEAKTRFVYENEQLVAQQEPLGNYEVFCYREGAGDSCKGNWTGRLQWKAKAGAQDGSSWSEKVAYQYWKDGAVKSETYLSCANAQAQGCTVSTQEVRRVKQYSPDADKRPTWEASGSGVTPPVVGKRRYDAKGNLVAIGQPYNAPPDFCVTPDGLGSPQCAALEYDAADRLTSMTEYGTDGAALVHTCFAYDGLGNITEAVTLADVGGCSVAASCSALPADCHALANKYEHDDFGNLLKVTRPDTGDAQWGSNGERWFEYDAAGNRVKVSAEDGRYRYSVMTAYSYDGLGRQTSAQKISVGPGPAVQPIPLKVLNYDAVSVTACIQNNLARGRLSSMEDSYGVHSYGYDSAGRLAREVMVRSGKVCTLDGNGLPIPDEGVAVISYGYDANGNLTSLTYPNGREVLYSHYLGNGANDRVSDVSARTWTGSDWGAPVTLIAQAGWEPYGRLKAYQVQAPLAAASDNVASVEYLIGGQGSSAPICNQRPPLPGSSTSDQAGRLRALWVSTGPLSGGQTGDIFQRGYQWTGDQLVSEDSCVLGQTSATHVEYWYDSALRLMGVSGAYQTPAGGVSNASAYNHDGRLNRLYLIESLSDPSSGMRLFTFSSMGDALHPDQLMSADPTNFSYEVQGRAIWKSGVTDSSGMQAYAWRFEYVYPWTNWGPVDDVYRSVSFGGGISSPTYNYYYDGFSRRRLKVYPTNVQDEYFYGAGNELLEDRGNYSVFRGSPFPVDEYLWLDGRPVAFIRSKHTLSGDSWVREAGWGSGDCTRNGEAMACGVYFIVSDQQGKAVLVLDSSRRVAGVSDYDPYGSPNRGPMTGQTPHPYDNSVSGMVLGSIFPPATSGVQTDVRALYHAVDTEGASWDYAYLANSSGNDLGYDGHVGGWHQGRRVSGWAGVPADGRVDVRFNSDGSNYCMDPSTASISCPSTACAYCPPGSPNCACPTFPYWGVGLQGYEYRRYQAGASPVWMPLRFPGQYYDAETDLVENWNRYYDPSIGRYLSIDPMTQDPKYLRAMAQRGMAVPMYAYALNNPMAYVDPTGSLVQGGFPASTYKPSRRGLPDLSSRGGPDPSRREPTAR